METLQKRSPSGEKLPNAAPSKNSRWLYVLCLDELKLFEVTNIISLFCDKKKQPHHIPTGTFQPKSCLRLRFGYRFHRDEKSNILPNHQRNG